ncbi:hypothetical protein [Kribbella albertanoniae]|uniref:DUF4345 domain-containing protein n=1 Tax=Kribbella albertanoniae TaxID=1266829 RepID=A0A4R4PYQ6_9ACTN|nr:hypothetical protein [Kribbella albertanoniae]TDC27687.1 hypothetical protein E1261_20250 [Kribbella albertanoniae]
MLLQTTTASYRRLVRASAWYDLIVTAGFATPWTYVLVHRFLSSYGGFPPVDPIQTLFANLMGSVVVVWALLRLFRTLPLHGLYDGIARLLFATWQLYALAHGATPLLWAFLAIELTFGAIQLIPWALQAKRIPVAGA